MSNLFAACRQNGQIIAKRVPLDRNAQKEVRSMFARQEAQFREDVTDEVQFDGGWKADDNEVLTLEVPSDAAVLVETVETNALSIPIIDTGNIEREGIRGLFTKSDSNGEGSVVLVQLFTAAQVLSRRYPLIMRGNTFEKLVDAAFAVGSKLECIIEDNRLKFKSFYNVRKIIGSMSAHFRAATDEEMRGFAEHEALVVEDVDAFVELADETTRKLVRAVSVAGVLDNYRAEEIMEAGRAVGMELDEREGRITLPMNRAELKKVIRFLDDGLYEAPLTKRRYVTNSKRPVR